MTLVRETLTQQAFNLLAERIIQRKLEPGDPLPSTSELAEEYGISRPVVREALSALEACGFIDVRSGRTAVVSRLDGRLIEMFVSRAAGQEAQPMSALMEVREPLESRSAWLAAERADASAVSSLLSMADQMRTHTQDRELYPKLDADFHAAIASMACNTILLWMITSIRAELMGTMGAVREYRELHNLVGQEQNEHEEIAKAIASKDRERARSAMERHLRASTSLIREVELAQTSLSS